MSGEPTAVIKLTRSEINKTIRSLVLSVKISEMFDYNNDNGDKEAFIRLKDDFIKVQNQLIEGERQVTINGTKNEEETTYNPTYCEPCE
tara:strand:+ start:3687 stop:3953 length:267 start_codon:yes stop_codon:yes gene_type:complete